MKFTRQGSCSTKFGAEYQPNSPIKIVHSPIKIVYFPKNLKKTLKIISNGSKLHCHYISSTTARNKRVQCIFWQTLFRQFSALACFLSVSCRTMQSHIGIKLYTYLVQKLQKLTYYFDNKLKDNWYIVLVFATFLSFIEIPPWMKNIWTSWKIPTPTLVWTLVPV